MNIAYMHDFENFSFCWSLPFFMRVIFEDILNLLSGISFFILLSAYQELRADKVRICVVSPYRINDISSHLLDSTHTHIFILQLLFLTIDRSNLLIDIDEWSLRNRFLYFIYYHMASITHRI
jgi:hypothetical protein